MNIDAALRAYLLTKADLTALIGTKIYPDEAPQGTALPYVTYIDVSDIKQHTHDGQLPDEQPIKQYTVYAATKSQSKVIAELIKAALKDQSGVFSGVTVQYITLLNEFSSSERIDTTTIYFVDLEYLINFIKE